jgi:hypothetical protein
MKAPFVPEDILKSKYFERNKSMKSNGSPKDYLKSTHFFSPSFT